jgi:hypothetical protein
LTSPSQPRNARSLPLIRARGLRLADNNPSPDDIDGIDGLVNPLNLQNPRQDDPAPGNAAPLPKNDASQDQQQPAPGPVNPPAQSSVKTIQDFINEVFARYSWFPTQQIPEEKLTTALNSYTHIETYKQLDQNSFQVNVAGDSHRAISWIRTPAGTDGTPEQQRIQGQSDGFDLSDARAMVALSAVNGWNQINVHGSEHERQLLWFAAQEQGVKVLGYEPAHDSDIYKQWQQMHQNPDDDSAPPVIKGGSSGPGPNIISGPPAPPAPQPPVNDNTPPPEQPPAPPEEDQEPDMSALNKEQLTYLLERYTAEEKYATSQNDPNLKDITRIKEAAAVALAKLNAKDATPEAPVDTDTPADTIPPADTAKKPAEKPVKKTKPAAKSPATKSTAPTKDTSTKPADDAAANDKYAGGKTTGEFNDKAPAPAVKPPAAPAQNKPVQLGGQSAGRHHAGTGHTNAKSVINREQKIQRSAAPK